MRPVFIDLETRSAFDLKAGGGWNYAHDATTHLLTVSWSEEEGKYSVWLPTVDEFDPELLQPPSQELLDTHLPGIDVFYGEEVPPELAALVDRPWCAHNAWTFDELVWSRLQPQVTPVEWLDSYPLALACGLPGGLNAIGQRLWGSGKYEEGSRIATEATRVKDIHFVDPVNVPVGALVQVARYNVQDVRLLAWLWEEIERTLVLPEEEKQILQMHRLINSRGIKIDTSLIAALVRLSTDCRTNALSEINSLTKGTLKDLSDLRSRKTVFDWLASVGIDLGKKPSLRKEIIQKYIERTSIDKSLFPEEVQDEEEDSEDGGPQVTNLALGIKVLELRMSALRITDSKLEAAAQSLDVEGIVRGLFAYWAAHTGRWAGRRIQVHNLPKPREGVNVWKGIELFEETKTLDYEKMRGYVREAKAVAPKQTRFLSVDDYTSAMIRLLFVPTGPGMAVADLSNIEARVLAWLAGEEWLMKAFWSGTDPYMSMATKIFGPTSSWPMEGVSKLSKHPYRAVGKIVELGCLAEGTPVLTHRGWVKIEDVHLSDKLWDGDRWVSHGGVIFSGVKECQNVAGVWMTRDHQVLTDTGWQKAEDLRNGVVLSSARYSAIGQCYLSSEDAGEESQLWKPGVPVGEWSIQRQAMYLRAGLPVAMYARNSDLPLVTLYMLPFVQTPDIVRDYLTVSPHVSFAVRTGIKTTGAGAFEYTLRGWRIGESFLSTYSPCQDGITQNSALTVLMGIEDTNRATYDSQLDLNKTRIAARTYDILNVGTKSRFQAGGLIVHNCGYQMGITKFSIYAAAFGIDLESVGTSAKECVISYRKLHPAIAGEEAGEYKGTPFFRNGFWHRLNDASIQAVKERSVVRVGKLVYEGDGKHLLLHLPSGRRLVYRGARVAHVVPSYARGTGKTVEAVQYASPRFGWNTLYGGKDAENGTQAVARDVMAHGLLRVEQAGMPILIHVHDEGGADTTDLDRFMSEFTTLPKWLPDFPLDAEGGLLPRYSKSVNPRIKFEDGRWRKLEPHEEDVKEVVYRNGKPYV